MDDTIGQAKEGHQPLSTRLRQQELVAMFGMYAIRASNLEGVLDQACELACRGLETRFAKVMAYRSDSQDFLLQNGVGWRPGVVGHEVVEGDYASPAGYAFHTRSPVVSNHLLNEDRFRVPSVLVDHGVHRAINVIVDGEDPAGIPYGVLEVDASEREDFTVHDVAFLQSLANVLSAALVRQRHQEAQERLLREKDILMQEVHHRIKNSLQLVQTMLSLQARGLPDTEERSRLTEAAARIMSIAAVHRRLHEEGAVEHVELEPYLSGLLADLVASLGTLDETRRIALDVEPMQLPAEHVTPLGLIVVELVTNAAKYGAGPITLRLRRTEVGVDLVVEDHGTGFPAGSDGTFKASLGMRLVGALARTPNAITLGRHAGGGAAVTVRVTFSAPVARLLPS